MSVNVTNVMPASEIVVKALISFDLAVRTPCVQLELEMCAEAHFRTYRCWQYKTCQDGVGDSEIEDRAYFRKVMFYGVQRNGVLIFLLICQP